MAAITPPGASHRAHGALLHADGMFPDFTTKCEVPDSIHEESWPIAIEEKSPLAAGPRLPRDCHDDGSNAGFHRVRGLCGSTQLS